MRYRNERGECHDIDSVPVRAIREARDVRETSGRAYRSNRTLRYFPPAVGEIPFKSRRYRHRLVHRLASPTNYSAPIAQQFPGFWIGGPRLVHNRSAGQSIIDAYSGLSLARKCRLTICLLEGVIALKVINLIQ